MEKIILIGGGGHCKVVIDAILSSSQYEIEGILDANQMKGEKVLDFPVIGTGDELEHFYNRGIKLCLITVGSLGNPDVRMNLFHKAQKVGFKFPNIIHPSSIISRFSKIGEGNYIAPGVIINAGVIIGNHCIINTGAIIDHDCKIGDFVHIAPGVSISGGVEIGNNSHIGIGTSIRQYLKIGENTIIGAGSVVVKDIPDNIVAFGNPCKEMRKNLA